ncbi:MAG: hypothetical protein ACK5X3_01905 [Pseudomonadota bacterium]
MSEEQDPFEPVARATVGEGVRQTFTIPSPLEAIESARTQARAELRDRFAMAALTGLFLIWDHSTPNRDQMAAEAWRQADAMLKARGNE